MVEDSSREPTRRRFIETGASIGLTGALAGCTGTGTNDESEAYGDTATTEESASYTVDIEPAGEVRFDSVPETWAAAGGAWVDMGVALGVADGVVSLGSYPAPQLFYDELDAAIDRDADEGYWRDGGYDKETFYELDADVHFLDPIAIQFWDDNWDESDIEEISQSVGPICGNNCRRRRDFREEHDYPLYSLYEAFGKFAEVFQRTDRYEALAELHEEVLDEVRSRLPPESDRPEIGLINSGSDPSENLFYPMDVTADGYELKTYRDLGVVSAFEDTDGGGSEADYEYLLEVDPDILVVHWGIGNTTEDGREFDAEAFAEMWLEPMRDDEVGRQLTAVQEGNVLPGAWGEQGPIVNLFQTELTARQLYPDEFGAFDPESFPEVPEDEQLFDRDRLAAIVRGEF